MHIVIIGNGVAGATVAQKLQIKVLVTLSPKPYGFYSRIMLPHSLTTRRPFLT